MKELVVISGKGGTGKTSIVAAFATLAKGEVVLADCDVDASDLHLVLEPDVKRRENFSGGSRAWISSEACTACGKCATLCRFDAIRFDGPPNRRFAMTYRVDPIACEGCGVCACFCPDKAILFEPVCCGEWFVSQTRCGSMVHAKLGVAQENSGKLVSTVRRAAREIAESEGRDLVVIDGSPGIGCPVIASLSGATLALVVTEPTLSGLHDLRRIVDLTKHFAIPTLVCINKWNLHEEIAARIEREVEIEGVHVAGRVRYDSAVTKAQVAGQTIIEYTKNGVAADVLNLWKRVAGALERSGS